MKNVVFFLLAFSFLATSCGRVNNTVKEQTVYDRVIKSGTIRVGFVSYEPGFIIDPNKSKDDTNRYTGIFYEVLMKSAKNLGLKVQFVEELNWGTMIEALNNHRVDLVCSPVWPTSERGKYADFLTPIYYSAIRTYVRSNDTRFDGNISILNSSEYKISTIDGELSVYIKAENFPNAKAESHTQNTDVTQIFLDLQGEKADVAFQEPVTAYKYMKANPGKIKEVEGIAPVRIYPNVMMIAKGEYEFQSMLNNTIDELYNIGVVDNIIAKYEPFKGAFARKQLPYQQ